jgi:hypothetical protein
MPAMEFIDDGDDDDCTLVRGAGVDGDLVGDPAIGGSDSNRFAPKEDEGLKGLTPPKPVCCGWRDEMDVRVVVDMLPVGLLERCEKSEREAVVVACCGTRLLGVESDDVEPKPELWEVSLVAKEEATLAITPFPGPDCRASLGEAEVGWLPCVCPTSEESAMLPFVNVDPLPNALVAICCSVGGFGRGGVGVTGGPNGFLEPVWWVVTAGGVCDGFCCEMMGVDCGRVGGENSELSLLEIGDIPNDWVGCWTTFGDPMMLDPCALKGCVNLDGSWPCPPANILPPEVEVKAETPVDWGKSILCRKGLEPVVCGCKKPVDWGCRKVDCRCGCTGLIACCCEGCKKGLEVCCFASGKGEVWNAVCCGRIKGVCWSWMNDCCCGAKAPAIWEGMAIDCRCTKGL